MTVLLMFSTPGLALPGPGSRPGPEYGGLLKIQYEKFGTRAVVRAVREAIGGRVLTVTRIRTDAGPAYRVKVLLQGGRVRTVLVDAASGALYRME